MPVEEPKASWLGMLDWNSTIRTFYYVATSYSIFTLT